METLKKLIRNRDRIFVSLALIAFGVYSLIDPTPSMSALPELIAIPSYVMFIMSGVALFAGYVWDSFETFVLGHILAITNTITVSAVILFSSASSVALLIFGFAVAMAASLHKVIIERKFIKLAQKQREGE